MTIHNEATWSDSLFEDRGCRLHRHCLCCLEAICALELTAEERALLHERQRVQKKLGSFWSLPVKEWVTSLPTKAGEDHEDL